MEASINLLMAVVNQVAGKDKAGALGEVHSFGQIAGDSATLDKVVHPGLDSALPCPPSRQKSRAKFRALEEGNSM